VRDVPFPPRIPQIQRDAGRALRTRVVPAVAARAIAERRGERRGSREKGRWRRRRRRRGAPAKGRGWWRADESTCSRLLQPPSAGEGGHLLGSSSSLPRPAPPPQYVRDREGWPVWGGRRSSARWSRGDEPADLHGTSSSTSRRIQGPRPCSRTGSKAAALLTRSSTRVLRLLGAPRRRWELAGAVRRRRQTRRQERERGVPPPLLRRQRWERVRGGRRRGGAAPARGLPVRGERTGAGWPPEEEAGRRGRATRMGREGRRERGSAGKQRWREEEAGG
jgi:hypothetical protein